MKVSEYNYQLPPELIAQFPPEQRSDSRMLRLNCNGEVIDLRIRDLVSELSKDDLLVLNDTKVIPARLYGRKESGGKLEILLERIISPTKILTQIRASKAPKVGQKIFIDNDESSTLVVTGRKGSFFEIDIKTDSDLHAWFEQVGHIPLPPYIDRDDQSQDVERYQTVFAKQHGAVAAPTAGLHYDNVLLDRLRSNGIRIETLTLHVGAGTYQPVRVDSLEEHEMHSETIEVSEDVCNAIIETKAKGGKVVAAGTTVVRSLETAALAVQNENYLIQPFSGETNIFIYPGFEFKVVDVLQTNFHLPQSTLLMLVSAFAGKKRVMRAYEHAIAHKYRFFSYGDTMLLERAA